MEKCPCEVKGASLWNGEASMRNGEVLRRKDKGVTVKWRGVNVNGKVLQRSGKGVTAKWKGGNESWRGFTEKLTKASL